VLLHGTLVERVDLGGLRRSDLLGDRLDGRQAAPVRKTVAPSARRSASRRPAKAWDVPGVEPLEPTRLVSLAFVTALQVLPSRQVAVLLLRDVLGFRAGEVADMLDTTVDAVNGALERARGALLRPPPPPTAGSRAEEAVVGSFVRAWAAADVDALVALLTDDVAVSMPPIQYEGRDLVARFCAGIFAAGRRFDLVPTRANGQPAFGAYLRGCRRRQPRGRPVRPHPRGRPDPRDDPLRERRARAVRAA
jgi:ketosteroid isomerase-like protein